MQMYIYIYTHVFYKTNLMYLMYCVDTLVPLRAESFCRSLHLKLM